MRKLLALVASSVLLVGPLAGVSTAAVGDVTGSYLQIVAHPDDDILFMSPDVQTTLNAGRPITTVFLTSGEGFAAPFDDTPVGKTECFDAEARPELSQQQYAECRHRGARAAWERMAGRPNAGDEAWDIGREMVTYLGLTRYVEINRLRDTPVSLVWVNLPEHGNKHGTRVDENDGTGDDASLFHLWSGRTSRYTTVPAASAVEEQQVYDHEDVVNLLVGLIAKFGATVVRVQDVEPDNR